MPLGKLVVVGTGIVPGHLTAEARTAIERADAVLYAIASPLSERLVTRLKPDAESLSRFYGEGTPRTDAYAKMVERILERLREGITVCAAFYGHPGIFVYPSHEAVRRARAEGHEAVMLPAVSSLDCLFADLGVDPAVGCQMFEASDLLLSRRALDPTSVLIVWQIGVIGVMGVRPGGDPRNLPVLAEYLAAAYGPAHRVAVYEAAEDPRKPPVIQWMPLAELPAAAVSLVSTLYVPPREQAAMDREMAARLGLPWEALDAARGAGRATGGGSPDR
jgi:uncharacterized protein YabN with tetrapyrrole methylase and pyrophosphatase domain